MIRLAIVVEGHTEREFVNNVLADELKCRGIESKPILLGHEGGGRMGGDVRVPRLGGEMARSLDNHHFVTSLVDFYGFGDKASSETVGELEGRISAEVRRNARQTFDRQRVFPYVQQYEFEALLFSDVNAFAAVLPRISTGSVTALREVRCQFPSPEDINDDPGTAPSKQIGRVIRGYNKRRDGYLVAKEIGLDKIRAECPRFNEWVTRLEALGNAPAFA